jgi:hypothetical protein
MATNLLPSLAALTLDTEAKEKKQKAKQSKGPYDKPKAPPVPIDIPMKQFPEEALPEPMIRTRNPKFGATQAEKTWIREQYGPNWFNVSNEQKEAMKEQARKVIAISIAPILEERVKQAEAQFNAEFQSSNYNAEGAPKLDFGKDLVPFLNAKHPPDWRKGADGSWLSQAEKDARSIEAKAEWRAERVQKLQAEKEKDWAVVREKVLDRNIEELQFPDEKGVRRARALLRHWFNRAGTDGKKRDWHDSVSPELRKKRLKWATTVVKSADYDHTNPAQPPQELYAPEDVSPFTGVFLPDPVPAVSAQGGQWVWKYMRALSSADIENTQTYTDVTPMEEGFKYWDASFRAQQMESIKDQYTDFIESLNDMSDLPEAKAAALSYTKGSGKFNKYILWPASKIGSDPKNIPLYGAGQGGVAGSMASGEIGPPDILHRLYKLINRCPRLTAPCFFVRGVKSESDLPHNLGKTEPVAPVVGRGYLNVTFMSTSTAAPSSYTSGILSGFYNNSSKCCLYIITAPKGTPILPLVVGGASTSVYASEQEVMFPPGLVLVFQGTSQKDVGSYTTTIHFYEARAPPQIPLPAV